MVGAETPAVVINHDVVAMAARQFNVAAGVVGKNSGLLEKDGEMTAAVDFLELDIGAGPATRIVEGRGDQCTKVSEVGNYGTAYSDSVVECFGGRGWRRRCCGGRTLGSRNPIGFDSSRGDNINWSDTKHIYYYTGLIILMLK